MTPKQISSPQNPFIKNISLLAHKARERKPQGLFVAEGLREVGLALQNGYEAEALLFDEGLTPFPVVEALAGNALTAPKEIIATNRAVFEKIAYRSSVPNVVGLFKMKHHTLTYITFRSVPFILVAESVEKPGNLGAILRTADAAGVDAVLVCDPQCDVFNPNCIRASLGAVFTVPVVVVSPEEAVLWLKQNNILVLATYLEASQSFYDCDLSGPLALVMGTEATGISDFWVKQSDDRVIIPMSGQVDSLNVSSSAAVMMFEVVRQRMNERTRK